MKISCCSRPTRTATNTASARPAEVSNVGVGDDALVPDVRRSRFTLEVRGVDPDGAVDDGREALLDLVAEQREQDPLERDVGILRVLVEHDLADQIRQRGVAERRIARIERAPEAGGNGRLRGQEPLAPHREAGRKIRERNAEVREVLAGRRGRRGRPRRYRRRRRRGRRARCPRHSRQPRRRRARGTVRAAPSACPDGTSHGVTVESRPMTAEPVPGLPRHRGARRPLPGA